jgi:hypothetical protein
LRVEANVIKADSHGVEILRKKNEVYCFATEKKERE